MDTTPDRSLINAFGSGFKIEKPLGAKTNREELTARLLVLLDYPRQLANDYRDKLNLKQLYDYPTNSKSLADLDDFLYELTQSLRDTAFEGAELIVGRYGLSNIWSYSFAIAILTDHLPLLPDPGIRLHVPGRTPMKKLSAELRRNSAANSDSILIEVTRQIKIEDLRRFLADNKSGIEAAFSRLPARPTSKLEERALFWGYLASILKRDEPKLSWSKMSDKLEEVFDGIKTPAKPESYEELRLFYRRYQQSTRPLVSGQQS